MTDSYLEFRTRDGGTVFFAVEPSASILPERASGSGSANAVVNVAKVSFESALVTVSAVAEAFAEQMSGLPRPPQQINLTFSLEVNADLGVIAVAKAGAKSSLSVSLQWTGNPPATSVK